MTEISKEKLLWIYERMRLIRAFEDQVANLFNQKLVEDTVFFHDLGSPARAEGIDRALEVCLEQIEQRGPDLVAFDSFKALHDLVDNPSRPGPSSTTWRST